MKKITLLFQLFIIQLSFAQSEQIELLLPHSEYTTPNGCFIGDHYAITYNEAYNLSFCSFDLSKMQFLNSGLIEDENWESERTEIAANEYLFMQQGFGSLDTELQQFSNEALPTSLTWRDREFNVIFGETAYYQEKGSTEDLSSSEEKRKPISKNIVDFYIQHWKEFRYLSISPNGEQIALVIKEEVHVFNTVSGETVWTSPRIKSFKTAPSFKLMDGGLIVLPENFLEDKPFEVTWFDYVNSNILYSTAVVSGGIFVGEYQGMHYYTFATGNPETGKIEQTQYINLKTGEFSAPESAGRRQRYSIGHHIVDEVLKNEVSKARYERFMENYTQYTSLSSFFSEYYAFLADLEEKQPDLYNYYEAKDFENEDIVKTKLTPMTLSTDLFKAFPLPFSSSSRIYDSKIDQYEVQYAYEGKATLKKYNAQLYDDLRQDISKKIIFWNSEMPETKREVWLVSSPNGTPIFITPDNYFFSTKDVKDFLAFTIGDKRYSFEQFDLKYNRPDIILERLGYADTNVIKAYHSAYLKRLEKLGFNENMLEESFDLPTCQITNLEDIELLTDQDKIELNIEAYSEANTLNRLEIWINDVPIYGSKGLAIENKVKSLEKTISLPLKHGVNDIKVAVMNDAGAQSIKEELVVRTTAGKSKPDLYIVSIGVSKYIETEYDLAFAAKDAQDFTQLFEQNKSLYQEVKTLTLVNEQVTHAALNEIREFLNESRIDDQVILFIAGHGVLDERYDYYLATHDMNFNNPKAKGIQYAELEALLDGIQPINKLMLLDACHGGEFDKADIAQTKSSLSASESGEVTFRAVGAAVNKTTSESAFELSRKLFVDLRKGTGATVISSSGGFEFAIEGTEWNNGLFTYCLLDGLKNKKADLNLDGKIFIDELQSYVANEVHKLSNGMQKPTSRRNNSLSNFQIW